MSYPLAIAAPHIGVRSETFIRRHMEDLLPGQTVVVAGNATGDYAGNWSIDCPTLVLNQRKQRSYLHRMLRAFNRRLGIKSDDLAHIKYFLKQHKVQVILGEYLDFSLPWLSLARDLGIRFFAHAHGYDVSMQLRDPKWQVEYLHYNQADGVITMSQLSRTRLLNIGLEADRVHVIPYGTDVPPTPFLRNKQDAGTIRCLAVGRMVAKKAPILMLDAFRRALEVCPNLQLDYIGTGPLLPAVHQFIRAFQLSEKIRLHDAQPSVVVFQLMKEADIFLQHSMTDPETGDEEGLPVAILEAMAYALPVVSTKHAGIPEAVIDKCTGYLVEEGDSIKMAEAIIDLARNRGLRIQMGNNAWELAKENFSCEKEIVRLQNAMDLR
jgi:colanic acid/amylovoran biosynthesis glycosyltransferase